jgi:putative restriction endonuclease
MMSPSDDTIRLAAFDWLSKQVATHGEVLPRTILQTGFELGGIRVPLLGPQGIFKPAVMRDIPLSIVTSPGSPYSDGFGPDGLLQYKYRGTDPQHRDNVGLREAMRRRIPLIYFHGVEPGQYLASWPVYIVGDQPGLLVFSVVVDDIATVRNTPGELPTQVVPDDTALFSRRAYVTRLTRIRLHQQAFRIRVLNAYQRQCACCRLRHQELLDAAHIVPDTEPDGEPHVSNGIALCKLHHAAFDGLFIGISPDHIIQVRPDLLAEEDGPMLLHGLQGLNGKKIVLPHTIAAQPNPELLDRRFSEFRRAI